MAKKILSQTDTITKLDIINSEASKSFRELVGADPVPVKGAALIEDANKDGVITQFAYVFCNDGVVFGGNSATIYRGVDGLIDLMGDDPEAKYAITVDERPTASGREFLSLRIVEL